MTKLKLFMSHKEKTESWALLLRLLMKDELHEAVILFFLASNTSYFFLSFNMGSILEIVWTRRSGLRLVIWFCPVSVSFSSQANKGLWFFFVLLERETIWKMTSEALVTKGNLTKEKTGRTWLGNNVSDFFLFGSPCRLIGRQNPENI